jgi:hypothetical protein
MSAGNSVKRKARRKQESPCHTPTLALAPARTKAMRPIYPPVVVCEVGDSPGRIEELKKQATADFRDDLARILGIESGQLAIHLVNQAASPLSAGSLGHEQVNLAVNLTIDLIAEIGPTGGLQGLLATQMIGTHTAAAEFMKRAMVPSQSSDVIDLNIHRAGRLMRLFTQQVDSMQKLKGLSGQQTVTVEHVHVHAGGQAIVGQVTPHASTPGQGGAEGGREGQSR